VSRRVCGRLYVTFLTSFCCSFTPCSHLSLPLSLPPPAAGVKRAAELMEKQMSWAPKNREGSVKLALSTVNMRDFTGVLRHPIWEPQESRTTLDKLSRTHDAHCFCSGIRYWDFLMTNNVIIASKLNKQTLH